LSPREEAITRFSVSGNVIVTGGAGDLGRASARALLQHGAKGLCIFDTEAGFATSRQALDKMYAEYSAEAHKFIFLEEVVNVTDENAIERSVKKAVEKLGSIDILVCFAGIATPCKSEEMTLALWSSILNVNTTGSWLCAKAVGKEMIRQGTGGSIVFTASVTGHHPAFPVPQSAYSVSKAGVIALTKNLAAEWAEHGIRANSISPGLIETRLSQVPAWEAVRRPWNERTPLGRTGVPEEIVGPVVMLCSPAARYITGIDILIDGQCIDLTTRLIMLLTQSFCGDIRRWSTRILTEVIEQGVQLRSRKSLEYHI
ncbi:NAD(P)-binding protein, partial [Pholiota conissans]